MKHQLKTLGVVDDILAKGLSTVSQAAGGDYPGSAGNEIVHSATGTDYIVYNAGGDTIVYG